MEISKNFVHKFKENGFAVIPQFLNDDEVSLLKTATDDLIKKYCQDTPVSVFYSQSRDTYFAESGDKIRGFFEEEAVDEKGHVVVQDLDKALNKIGHALHKFEPRFNRVTFSSKVRDLVTQLSNMEKPTVIQSMVIFKQPQIGGRVIPHQDVSFLYLEPKEGNLLGFWIALEEATPENGCLHFVPGSQKTGKLHQRFIRNPDKGSNQLFIYQGNPVPTPSPEELVAAPCKPGDLVLIDGLVIHQSSRNTSTRRRLAYTFHVLEGKAKYSEDNWLQPTSENTFMEFPIK